MTRRVRVAVVGHVEWVLFVCVPRLPPPGQIAHATRSWEDAGGGGAVAAVQLRRLAGEARLLTALGDDAHGRLAAERLRKLGVNVECAWRDPPHRRAVTFLDGDGERTITTLGDRIVPHGDDPLPWPSLGDVDGVYFTGGDVAALRAARRAGTLVATPRARETIAAAGVELDALVYSDGDERERAAADQLADVARVRVATRGGSGGVYERAGGEKGRWDAARPPGPPVDAYGAGDSFAAGLAYGLAAERDLDRALAIAARCGAACVAGRGPYERQLTLAPG